MNIKEMILTRALLMDKIESRKEYLKERKRKLMNKGMDVDPDQVNL